MSNYNFEQGDTPEGESRIVLTTTSDDGSLRNVQIFGLNQFEEYTKACQEALIIARANMKQKDKN